MGSLTVLAGDTATARLSTEHGPYSTHLGAIRRTDSGAPVEQQWFRCVMPFSALMLARSCSWSSSSPPPPLALFVACADVTLFVAEQESRRKAQELKIEMALGASRGRLIRESMADGLLAAVLGAGLGLVLAAATRGWLVGVVPSSMPRASEIRLGVVAVAGTIVLSMALGITTTLLPALWVLRAESQSTVYVTGNRHSYGRVGRVLTGFQATVTVVVLSLTVIVFRSYSALARVDLGFDPLNVVTVEIVTSNGAYLQSEATLELEQDQLERLRRLPDVEAAGTTDQPPLGGSAAIFGQSH